MEGDMPLMKEKKVILVYVKIILILYVRSIMKYLRSKILDSVPAHKTLSNRRRIDSKAKFESL